jgi:hypothetical protein
MISRKRKKLRFIRQSIYCSTAGFIDEVIHHKIQDENYLKAFIMLENKVSVVPKQKTW